ncbi:hypothetical protein M011DRAFT_464532 [Sporormia fimetaria CBS 119925]|uniref:Uncharacterized protein n=1 Tax=Sporormia fimetaria CBS 119925 TaxID=1340428 RepID=A0A6A6VJB4_9PLEO|nr:hypothetical protein M011DRAFT_464532 [Sporormia fimetaria CBS 119925]
MEPPKKRPRTSLAPAADDDDPALTVLRDKNASTLAAKWQNIFNKATELPENEVDVIDMVTGTVVVDNGHMRRLESDPRAWETADLLGGFVADYAHRLDDDNDIDELGHPEPPISRVLVKRTPQPTDATQACASSPPTTPDRLNKLDTPLSGASPDTPPGLSNIMPAMGPLISMPLPQNVDELSTWTSNLTKTFAELMQLAATSIEDRKTQMTMQTARDKITPGPDQDWWFPELPPRRKNSIMTPKGYPERRSKPQSKFQSRTDSKRAKAGYCTRRKALSMDGHSPQAGCVTGLLSPSTDNSRQSEHDTGSQESGTFVPPQPTSQLRLPTPQSMQRSDGIDCAVEDDAFELAQTTDGTAASIYDDEDLDLLSIAGDDEDLGTIGISEGTLTTDPISAKLGSSPIAAQPTPSKRYPRVEVRIPVVRTETARADVDAARFVIPESSPVELDMEEPVDPSPAFDEADLDIVPAVETDIPEAGASVSLHTYMEVEQHDDLEAIVEVADSVEPLEPVEDPVSFPEPVEGPVSLAPALLMTTDIDELAIEFESPVTPQIKREPSLPLPLSFIPTTLPSTPKSQTPRRATPSSGTSGKQKLSRSQLRRAAHAQWAKTPATRRSRKSLPSLSVKRRFEKGSGEDSEDELAW